MDPRKVAAGIVTYNPEPIRLRECVTALLPQVDVLFIFDNASDDFAVVESLVDESPKMMSVPRPTRNRGMAFALNTLAAEAIARGYCYMLFMDQDSVAAPNLVEAELRCMLTNVGIASPQIIDRNETKQPQISNDAYEIPRAITSGALINLAAFEEVGGCDERLFVDWVDFELCDNLKNHSYKIICTDATYLLHEIGKKELAFVEEVTTPDGTTERREHYRTNHSSRRRFDKARSQAITINKYGFGSAIGHDEIKIFLKDFKEGLRAERRKPDLVIQTTLGFLAGNTTAFRVGPRNVAPGKPWDYSPWYCHDIVCFNLNDGTTSWRFSLPAMPDADDLFVVDSEGKTIATCNELGFLDGRQWVYAILPEELDAFELRSADWTHFALSPRMTAELRFHQNCLLANPGNDGLFHEFSDREEQAYAAQRPRPAIAGPKFSIIVPLFKSDPVFLRAAIDSVVEQTYGDWELVLVNANPEHEPTRRIVDALDDPRIIELQLEDNYGISGNTNRGIAAATGDYLAFLDHDDLLDPDALYAYAVALEQDPAIDIIFSDEDNFHESLEDRFMPIHKPALNLDLLLSHNYIVHFVAVSRRMIEATTRADDAVSGAQDYDLLLKSLETGGRCVNIPRILYHWRAHAGSTNGGQVGGKTYADEACVTVLSRYFARHGLTPEIKRTTIPYHYRVLHHASADERISLVLWGQPLDELATKAGKLLSAFAGDDSPAKPCEVVLVPTAQEDLGQEDPGQEDPGERHAVEEALSTAAIASDTGGAAHLNQMLAGLDIPAVVSRPASALSCVLREAAASAQGASLVFVGPDVEDVANVCPDLLVGYLALENVGIVAAKGFTREGLIYHAGMALDDEGKPVYLNRGLPDSMGGGYLGAAECSCAYSLVGPQCFAIRKDALAEALEGQSDVSSPLAAMADLCFSLRKGGMRCVAIPDATVTCHNTDKHAENVSDEDLECLRARWSEGIWRRDLNANPHVNYSTGYPKITEVEPAAFTPFMLKKSASDKPPAAE